MYRSVDYERNPSEFNLAVECPKCGRTVQAQPLTTPFYEIGEATDRSAHLICRCADKKCSTVFFVVYDRADRRVVQRYPFPRVSAEQLHESIPGPVREDFAEARKCWYGASNKGVVVLCRRAVQSMAVDKGAKGRDLKEQIADLRVQGLVTQALAAAANEVRFFGNFGAHPQDDGLDNITDEDAQIVMGLTESFLMDLYIRPFETAKMTQKRVAAGRQP